METSNYITSNFPNDVAKCYFQSTRISTLVNVQEKSSRSKNSVFAIYNLPENDSEVTSQLAEIQSALELEEAESAGFNIRELVKQGPTRNFQRLSLACWSQIFQQISGINLITYYAGTIFENTSTCRHSMLEF